MINKTLYPRFCFIGLCLSLFLGACMTPQKLTYKGQYTKAIDLAVKKLSKKNKKDQHILSLEEAFTKQTEKDMGKITFLKKEGEPESWEEINSIANRIARRQEKVKPLLPLYVASEGNRKATLKFVRTNDLILESKEKAAAFLYARGIQLLEEAKSSQNKLSAREAFNQFDKIEKYYSTYKDKTRLMAEAKELGMNHVLFKMRNSAYAVIPSSFERELFNMNTRSSNSTWVQYHQQQDPAKTYDYIIVANMTNIAVSPETTDNVQYVEEKQIQEGEEFVYDQNGNVAKDTLGNDIKVPAYVTIYARVFETLQRKSGLLEGDLEYFNGRTNEALYHFPIRSEAFFENYAATFEGDRRALKDETNRKIGNRPAIFPNDMDMLYLAMEVLKEDIENLIRQNHRIVKNPTP